MMRSSPDDRDARSSEWERLSTAFVAVVSRPSQEWSAAIAEQSDGDAQLRAELESLVAAHDGAPAFLDALYVSAIEPALLHAAAADPSHDPAREPIAPVAIAPGTRIRHVIVHERLGSGGAGVVYRGRDTLLQRDVAIKILSSRTRTDLAAQQQLMREAQAASQLDDPNVCPIYAIEATAEGALCIVMGYCPGGTVRDRLREGTLAATQLLAIARGAASGLARAHRAGILHGDIKPANIGFGEGDVARLLDFGVASQVAHTAAADVTSLTGTLPYLAPELWRGAPRSTRSDVWALGVTLVEMVTGSRPFSSDSVDALADQIRDGRLPELRRPDGTSVPDALTRAIRAMVRTDPMQRPKDGAAALALLSADTATPASRRRDATRPPLLRAGVLALSLIGAAVLLARTQGSRTRDAAPAVEVARTAAPLPSLAVLPFVTRGPADVAYLANGMVDLLTPAFDATGLVRGIDPNSVLGAVGSATVDSSAARSIATRVGADRYVLGSVTSTGPTFTVRATLHDGNGREVGRAHVVAATSDSLVAAADALVRQLIATELRAPGDTIASVAAATTSSSRALRAYLDGERELRDARPAAAMEAFLAAVAADSTFALAWYRLARAARWSDVDSVSGVAAAQAHRFLSSLPVRQQRIVNAYHVMRFGSAVDAERLLRQIVADYPTDVDAWMLLGELHFFSNPFYGRPIAEAGVAFERVMALDPRNREVTGYLMELAASARRLGQLDTLFTMYFSPNSAGEQPGIRATYSALHARRMGSTSALRGWPTPLDDPALARVALLRISPEPMDRDAARSFATVMLNAPATRLDGLLALASIDVADGDWTRASARLQVARSIDEAKASETQALLALAPSISVPSDTLREVRRQLLASTASTVVTLTGTRTVEQEDVRPYLGGLLSVRLNDERGVEAARRVLLRRREQSSRIASALLASLDGHWQYRLGNLPAALAAFDQAIPDVPSRLRHHSLTLSQPLDRWTRAALFTRLGRPGDANRWAASLRESSGVWNAPFLADPTVNAPRQPVTARPSR
jgi:tRNA A-37 threonylcarbamoyl transferase component Bud32